MNAFSIARAVAGAVMLFASLAGGARDAHAMNPPTQAPPPTWTYRPLQWATLGGQGGPVLSPEIVPLYWGKNSTDWVIGDANPDNDPAVINAYLDGFANYISGANLPAGLEPVTKQYGVWGAQRMAGAFFCKGTCSAGDSSIGDVGIQQRIASLQASHVLPPSTPSRIFVVFLKGFTYQSSVLGCAYHDVNGSTYYAVIPFEHTANAPDGDLTHCSLQPAISHELLEAMTDAYPGNGWTYGADDGEGADECEPWAGVGAAGIAQFPWGFVSTFADNVTGSCSPWSWTTTSPLAATSWNGHVLDVFYPAPGWTGTPSTLMHAYTTDGSNWSSEPTASGAAPFNLVGAPAVVKPAPNRVDVFVRGVNGPSTALFHISKTTTGPWTMAALNPNNTVGQPSAVSTGTNRIDLVARHWDSSVVHMWSNDNTGFASEDFASQTIGSPTIVSPGFMNFDVYTFGMHADQVVNRFTNGGHWSGFSTLVSGVNGLLPVPAAVAVSNLTNRAVFAAMNGGTDFLEEEQVYWPRYTITNNGSWTNSYYALGNTSPFGAYGAASNSQGVDVAWMDRSSFAYLHTRFNTTTHSWTQITNTNNWDAVTPTDGQFMPPPIVAYGSDGATYLLGVGFDTCLYAAKFSGNTYLGLISTGVCSVM
jgi:hypothetical protein